MLKTRLGVRSLECVTWLKATHQVHFRFIDKTGVLEGPMASTPSTYRLVQPPWRQVGAAFKAQPPGRGPSKYADAPRAADGSRTLLRLLLQSATAPIAVTTDHFGYRAQLRQLGAKIGHDAPRAWMAKTLCGSALTSSVNVAP
jgi:hypothetical protein